MAQMKYRTTFAFDSEAIRRLKTLAAYWRVSQAEVVRRALEKAEEEIKREAADPYELLSAYHSDGTLTKETADEYLSEVDENRKHWRGQ